MDEKDASVYMHWRYAPETDIMLQPQSLKTWNYLERTHKWAEEKRAKGEEP
jgi:hypothetical protein